MKMYTHFQKNLFTFIAVVFLVIFLFVTIYYLDDPLLGSVFGRLLFIAILVVIGILCDRIKIDEMDDDTQGLRTKCPFCSAVYVYSAKSEIETGTYRCQNCAKIFTAHSN
jgi:predicted Zn finger-like uncharacterized protein